MTHTLANLKEQKQYVFSHKGVKLEINSRQVIEKFPIAWRLCSTFLNNTWVKEQISTEIKIYFGVNKNEKKKNLIQMYGFVQLYKHKQYLEGNLQ